MSLVAPPHEAASLVPKYRFWPWLLAAFSFGFLNELISTYANFANIAFIFFAFNGARAAIPIFYVAAFVIIFVKYRERIDSVPKRPSLLMITIMAVAQFILMEIGHFAFALMFGFIFNQPH